MRLLTTNLADTATITSSASCVATLPVTNLQTSLREQVARWTAIDAQRITLTWTSGYHISCVCLYRSNLSASSTWRVQVWSDTTLTTAVYDSGTLYGNPPVPLGSLEWGVDELGSSLYSDWGYAISTVWFTAVMGQAVTIDIADPENAHGYAQASRLFVGQYFEPAVLPTDGLQMAWQENTQQSRTEGGSLRVEPGASWRRVVLDLRELQEEDRVRLSNLARVAGMRNDVFLSVFPDRADELERDYQMQARIVTPSTLITNAPIRHNTTLTFEEV